MNENSHRRPVKRAPSKAREQKDRTKFDKWLDDCGMMGEIVNLVLDPSPFQTDTLNEVPARILEVDRYMICVEFQDYVGDDGVKNSYNKGNVWWIPKTSIMGAAPSSP